MDNAGLMAPTSTTLPASNNAQVKSKIKIQTRISCARSARAWCFVITSPTRATGMQWNRSLISAELQVSKSRRLPSRNCNPSSAHQSPSRPESGLRSTPVRSGSDPVRGRDCRCHELATTSSFGAAWIMSQTCRSCGKHFAPDLLWPENKHLA